MENVNLLNLHPNEWTAIGHRSYRSGPIEWDVHREFAERMFRKYVRLAEQDAVWLFHRRMPGTSTFDLVVMPKNTNKPAKPIQVVFSADKEAA